MLFRFFPGNQQIFVLEVQKKNTGVKHHLTGDSLTSLFQDHLTDDHDDDVDRQGFKQLANSALELNGHALELNNLSGTQRREEYALPVQAQSHINSRISIKWGDTPIDIARAIRKWSQQSYNLDSSEETQKCSLNSVIEALGWRLFVLCQEGNSDMAENLLRFLTEHVSYSNAEPIMGSLAQGFERFGLARLAVIAFMFAYTKSKSGGGWRTFGGKEHEEPLRAAVALNARLAFNELGMAIVDVLNGKYYGAQGITQALVQAFSSQAISAADMSTSPFELWDTAAEVIEDRLPPLGEDDEEFQRSCASQVKGLTHPSSNRSPDAYTLEQEAVERTLQEVAAGARVALAKENGMVGNPQEFERELAEALIDNPELPLRVAASRIPRPKLRPILESENTAVALPIVEQGPYKGWRILGAYESRITPGDEYKKIEGKTVLIKGGAEASTTSASHNHPIPFGYGAALHWLESKTESPFSTVTQNNLRGSLIGVEVDSVPNILA